MSQHPNKGHVLPYGEAYPLFVRMSLGGYDEKQILHALGLSRKGDLTPYRWQRAADLRRDNPTITWENVSRDAACGLRVNTLHRNHRKAQLACGLTWEEYLEGFRLAALEQIRADQRDYGQRFKALFDGLLSDVEAARGRLLDFDLNPRPVPAELGRASAQLGLGFEPLEGLSAGAGMTPAQQSWRNSEARGLISDLHSLHKLVQPLTAGADTAEEDSPLLAAIPDVEKQHLVLEMMSLAEQLGERTANRQGVA